ncbi:MAG: trigger factor family protein, partial [Chloroflexaceae bacterium]|nr:trigger factor family protein [Chloroflexaceae bacterium]
MKVTTEKLPRSLIALDVELDKDQVQKGLDRAARRISQKYTIPGFRKGKAPRFIVENYFGREALLEEATDDLINKSFKQALEQENIVPVGQASLVSVEPSEESFRFRVTVPVPPSVTLPDYRTIRLPLDMEAISDETVERGMDMIRERHVVLKELEEPRLAQQGDQLTVALETIVEGQALHEFLDDAEDDEDDDFDDEDVIDDIADDDDIERELDDEDDEDADDGHDHDHNHDHDHDHNHDHDHDHDDEQPGETLVLEH